MTLFHLFSFVKKVFFVIFLFASSCHNLKEHSGQTPSGELLQKSFLVDSALISKTSLHIPQSVRKFYNGRDFSLFWSDERGKLAVADSLLNFIRNAQRLGLIPHDYHIGELDKIARDSVSRDLTSRMDILLTDSYLTLRHHIRYGRLDPQSFQRLDLANTMDEEGIAALEKIVVTLLARDLNFLQPQAEPYQLLKRGLEDLIYSNISDSIKLQRLRAISVNMERWRWEKALPTRFVSVNIPAFLLRVVENDSVWLQSKVVVGKRKTPTPVLESIIRSFIIYPYWHVPFSISTKEFLPAIQADSSYLRKNNFDVLNIKGEVVDGSIIPWKLYDAENFPFILRQREGYENSMGIIKFIFANPYGVYLHDTNSKRLYGRKNRDLSHGCVRVHQAVDLAHYLIREDDIYVSPEDLDQYLSLQQRLKIDLRKSIPLRLQYFTCEVEKGVVQFYDDIYKKDSVMIQSLYRSNSPAEFEEMPL